MKVERRGHATPGWSRTCAVLPALGLTAALAVAVLGRAIRVARATWQDAGSLHDLTTLPLERLLTAGCALALAASLLWLLATAALMTAELVLLTCGHRLPRVGALLVPRMLRRLVLGGCGVAMVSATLMQPSFGEVPSPAPPHSLDLSGLSLPDRVSVEVRAGPAAAQEQAASRVVVAPGDSLWRIAATTLRSTSRDRDAPSAADIDRRWRAIYAHNQSRIGPDPDLLRPGTVLAVPAASSLPRSPAPSASPTQEHS